MHANHKESSPVSGPIPAVERPTALQVADVTGLERGPIAEILRSAGLNPAASQSGSGAGPVLQVVDDGAEAAASRISGAEGAHLLLCYRAPIFVLAESLAQGRPPAEALAEWMTEAESLLAICRQNRRRLTLVEATLATRNQLAFVERLNQRLGLSLALPSAGKSGEHVDPNPVFLLIADHTVRTDAEVRQMAAELEATAIPITPAQALLPDAAAACSAYGDQRAASEDGSKIKFDELKEENDLLLLQLHQVQEELEAYYLETHGSEGKLQQSEQRCKELEKECRAAKAKSAALDSKIAKMRKSRSWRITKPIRAWNKLFRRKANGGKNG